MTQEELVSKVAQLEARIEELQRQIRPIVESHKPEPPGLVLPTISAISPVRPPARPT